MFNPSRGTLSVAFADLLLCFCLQASCGAATVAQTDSYPVGHDHVLSAEQLGDLQMAHQEYAKAIKTYSNAAPDSAVLENKIGVAYHHLLAFDQARMRYQKAVAMNPKYAQALNNLGTIFYSEKNYHKAEKFYRKALKLTPNSAVIYVNLGTAYFADRRPRDGAEAYRTVLAIDPHFFSSNQSPGVAEFASLQERAERDYCLAELFAEEGSNVAALEYLRKALQEGFNDRKRLSSDQEFANLRNTSDFKDLAKENKL